MRDTLAFSESVKGWTSFFSFIPDFITRLNNRCFSVKAGELYMHDDENNTEVCNFYGTKYSSKIKTSFNDVPSDDKIFKTLVLEGDKPWSATLETNYTNSTLAASEFDQRESRWFTHTRNNEGEDVSSFENTQGIGVIASHSGFNVVFTVIGEQISIGDILYQLDGSTEKEIGPITAINYTTGTITVSVITNPIVNGLFAYSKKNARVEGSKMRGYYMDVELTDNTDSDAELFAVNTNAVKSYV